MPTSYSSLLAVTGIALAAPLLVSMAPRVRMPAVVLEIVLGIIVGPSVLGWVHVDTPVNVLAVIGLSFLLFLAGLELNLSALRGRVGRILGAYALSAVLALAGGAVVAAIDTDNKGLFIAIVLASTSLGLVVPVLRDAGQTFSPFGQLILAASSVGEFGAILALALFLLRERRPVRHPAVLAHRLLGARGGGRPGAGPHRAVPTVRSRAGR